MAGTLLRIACLLALVAAAAVGFTLHVTGRMMGVADDFLAAATRNDLEAGLATLAPRARREFEETLGPCWEATRLSEAGTFTWQRRGYTGGIGHLVGAAPLDQGGLTVQLRFRHLKGWRIDRFLLETGPDTAAPESMRQLFAATRARLANTVETDGYAELRETLTERYDLQLSTAILRKELLRIAATGLLQPQVDALSQVRVALDTGQLELRQALATNAGQFMLRFRYAFEEGHWKPDGIVVDRLEEIR